MKSTQKDLIYSHFYISVPDFFFPHLSRFVQANEVKIPTSTDSLGILYGRTL